MIYSKKWYDTFHGYNQIREKGEIRLFKSYNLDYEDGGQLCNFVYVKYICSVMSWMIKHLQVCGLFNVGTGRAQSFRDSADATFHALGLNPNIVYIEMPEKLRGKYQYFTQAKMDNQRVRISLFLKLLMVYMIMFRIILLRNIFHINF